jgi:hypothetical protein
MRTLTPLPQGTIDAKGAMHKLQVSRATLTRIEKQGFLDSIPRFKPVFNKIFLIDQVESLKTNATYLAKRTPQRVPLTRGKRAKHYNS